jgi:putative DNA primase/helicase
VVELVVPQPATDVGNAQRLVEQHGDELRYCYKWETWFTWDGQRWGRDETGEIQRRAKETVRHILGEAERVHDHEKRHELTRWAVQSEFETRLRAMVPLARSENAVAITPEQFDADPMLLNCNNDTLDLRTGELRAHSRADLLTMLAPVDYDPDAEAPTWLAFLDRIFDGNAELIEFIQRAVGHSLTGSTAEQVLFFLYGTGANGKSTFVEVLRAMLGDYAQQTDFTTLLTRERDNGPRNDVARLMGARFVADTRG